MPNAVQRALIIQYAAASEERDAKKRLIALWIEYLERDQLAAARFAADMLEIETALDSFDINWKDEFNAPWFKEYQEKQKTEREGRLSYPCHYARLLAATNPEDSSSPDAGPEACRREPNPGSRSED